MRASAWLKVWELPRPQSRCLESAVLNPGEGDGAQGGSSQLITARGHCAGHGQSLRA